MTPITIMPAFPVEGSPLEGTVQPDDMFELAIQMGVLADNGGDYDVLHIEADRLMILALQIAKVDNDANDIDGVLTAYKAIKKRYQ